MHASTTYYEYLLRQSRLKRLEIKLRAERGTGTANESFNRAHRRQFPKLIAPCGLLGLSLRLGQCLPACPCRDVSLVNVSAENTTTFQFAPFPTKLPQTFRPVSMS
jgi:hypothetical protein